MSVLEYTRRGDSKLVKYIFISVLLLILVVSIAEGVQLKNSGNNTWAGHNIVYNNTIQGKIYLNASNGIWINKNLTVNGWIRGGTNFAIYAPFFDLSASAADPAVFLYIANGLFRWREISRIGTNDLFFQGAPASTGWTVLEGVTGVGTAISTLRDDMPIGFFINRGEVARFKQTQLHFNKTIYSNNSIFLNKYMNASRFALNNGSVFDVIYGARGGIINNTFNLFQFQRANFTKLLAKDAIFSTNFSLGTATLPKIFSITSNNIFINRSLVINSTSIVRNFSMKGINTTTFSNCGLYISAGSTRKLVCDGGIV